MHLFMVKHFTFNLRLLIIGHYGDGVSGSSRSSTPATLASDPVTCPIIPGCETTIDISKGRTGLGLSIVGGCDTLLVTSSVSLYVCEYMWHVRKSNYSQLRHTQSVNVEMLHRVL